MQVREPSNFFCSTKYTIIGSRSDHLGVSSIGIAVPCGLLNGTIGPWHSVSLRIPQFLSSLDLPSAIALAQYFFFLWIIYLIVGIPSAIRRANSLHGNKKIGKGP